MTDPRYRLYRPILGEHLGEVLPLVTRVAARDRDPGRKEVVGQHREPVDYKVRALSPRVEPGPIVSHCPAGALALCDLVVNEGLTIAGKSMREHLEAINHQEAIDYVKYIVSSGMVLSERELLSIHNLILRGIYPEDAGKYRKVQVMITGSTHTPPQPFLVPKQMEDYFLWYEQNRKRLHPVVLAAEMHERLVTIHPFVDGNGRTARLIMNAILMQHGYIIANIKGDATTRSQYYTALKAVQEGGSKEAFVQFIADVEKSSLERYISILS